MNPAELFDPLSALIVVGGTLAATALRCGWRQCGCAVQELARLCTQRFDSDHVRSELAAQLREIDEMGPLRVEPHVCGDGEFDSLSDSLIRHGAIQPLYDEHDRHRRQRARLAMTACRVWSEAADLAPVLGLAGTLMALSGLTDSAADGQYGVAIGRAVTTTLYGLATANFLFAPLSGVIERRADQEEAQRKDLLDWLAGAMTQGRRANRPRASRAAA